MLTWNCVDEWAKEGTSFDLLGVSDGLPLRIISGKLSDVGKSLNGPFKVNSNKILF